MKEMETTHLIDLRSDTVTTPTAAMYAAMTTAPVGDDVLGDDPTVKRLERLAAERVEKEASLFLPSGTMANLVALMVHAVPGEEVILERTSHIYWGEGGGVSRIAGLHPKPVDAPTGRLPLDEVRALIVREDRYHASRTALICLENTHNARGGVPVSLTHTRAIAALARENELATHLDGARLFNAAVALQVSPRALCEPLDSVMFCLSKGLCAPIGSVLAGAGPFIQRARKLRQLLGGGMRQAGVVAAAGIVALDAMPEQIAEDHRLAALLAERLTGIPKLSILPVEIRTNMVFVRIDGSQDGKQTLLSGLARQGVLCQPWVGPVIRLVTHYGITEDDVEATASAFRGAMDEIEGRLEEGRRAD